MAIQIPDANNDGWITFGCIGDSNTAASLDDWERPSWPEQLAVLLNTTQQPIPGGGTKLVFGVFNYALSATGLFPGCMLNYYGKKQAFRAIVPPEAAADGLLVSFSVGDIVGGKTVAEMMAAYQEIVGFLPGRKVVIGTHSPCPARPDIQPTLDALNVQIRATFSFMDFDTGFDGTHFKADGIHLNYKGQKLKAQRAKTALQG